MLEKEPAEAVPSCLSTDTELKRKGGSKNILMCREDHNYLCLVYLQGSDQLQILD